MRSIVRGGAGLTGALVLLAAAAVCAQERSPSAARGAQLFTEQGCYGCHLVGKFGTPIGPDLSHLGAQYAPSYFRQWLHDPESVKPTAHMPKLELTVEEIEALAAYLASLR